MPYCPQDIVTPLNPCIGSNPCDQNYSSDCVIINAAPACLQGTRITLTSALVQICNALAGSDCCLLTIKVSLTAAQILASHTTPIQLIPSPGAGKFIQPITMTSNFKFNTSPYTDNTVLRAYIGTVADNAVASVAISDSTTILQTQTASNATITANTALMLAQQNANPVGGDSPLDLYITYKITTL